MRPRILRDLWRGGFLLTTCVLPALAWSATSRNGVAYINLPPQSDGAITMAGHPLIGATNLNEQLALPDTADGSTLSLFDATLQKSKNVMVWLAGHGWKGAGGIGTPPSIPLGEGFVLQWKGPAARVTMLGEVPQGMLTNPVPTGWSLKASQSARGGLISAQLEFVPFPRDQVYFLGPASHAPIPTFDDMDLVWISEPNLRLAEGFFFKVELPRSWEQSGVVDWGDPAGPTLSIRRAGSDVVLAWPDSVTGYVLEESASSTPFAWSPVVTPPVIVAGEYRVQLTPTAPAKYFRLRH